MKKITATQYNSEWILLTFVQSNGCETNLRLNKKDLFDLKKVIRKWVEPCDPSDAYLLTREEFGNIHECIHQLKYKVDTLETRMDNAATMNVENAKNIAEQRERIDNLTSYANGKVYDLNNKAYELECKLETERKRNNALAEELVRQKARVGAIEAIPEKDFRRDYCHDERLTLLEAKAEGTAKELQTQINNLPRRVRAIVKESLKD